MPDSVENKMAKGAVWMVLFKLLERSLGLISTLILARLLGPADFGMVAMGLSFIFMAELLTAFGFDIALIQNQDATIEHYNTAWTGNFLFGLAITVLMVALAGTIADFYQNPGIRWVVYGLAVGPLITGCENIGVVAFRRDLNFRKEFVFQLARKVIGFAVVVPLAFLLRNYWALVIGSVVSRLAGTTMSYAMHPFRPRFMVVKARELIGFSRWLLFNNIVGFFKERSSDFFIGRMHGAAALGAYNIGYELANLPTTELAAPVGRALLPGFAKMVTSEQVIRAYANAIGMLAMLALPAAAGIFAVAPLLVPVVLGSKWLDTIPLLQILAFNGALLLFHSSICSVLIARGFPSRVTATNLIYVGILVALLAVLSARFGVVGAAYAAVSTSLICTPIYLHQMRRCLGIGPVVFMRAIARPLTAALLMAAIVRSALPFDGASAASGPAVAWLVGGVALGAASYAALMLVIWYAVGRPDGPERILLDRARDLMRTRLADTRN